MSTPTPRRLLLDGMLACLRRIHTGTAEGFNTDAGDWVTDEPGQVTTDNLVGAKGQLAVWISQQDPAVGTGRQRTHRLTTVTVIVKVPSTLDGAQDALEAIVDDIEHAMEDQQQAFAVGIPFPTYAGMRPIQQVPGSNYVGATLRWQSEIKKR